MVTNAEVGDNAVKPSPWNPQMASWLARRLLQNDVTRGDMAQLRHMDPDYPVHPLFWKIAIETGIVRLNGQTHIKLEQAWAHVVRSMAHGTRVGRSMGESTSPHKDDISFGYALAVAGYKEGRLEKLLNEGEGSIAKAVSIATGFLDSKRNQFNWDSPAALMLTPIRTPQQFHADRVQIARDYYRATYMQTKQEEQKS